MVAIKKDIGFGLLFSIIFAIVLWVLIPFGIENPMSHDPNQLTPSSYPTWIATAGFILSVLILINSGYKFYSKKNMASEESQTDTEELESKEEFLMKALRMGTAFLALFALYYFINEIGMVIGCFILYIIVALLCGERNYIRLLTVNTILITLMYLFFVRVAAVSIPLGLLTGIL